eukprot:gene13400-13528_t
MGDAHIFEDLCSICVTNIPADVTDGDLMEVFQGFDASAKITLGPTAAPITDTQAAFVSFSHPQVVQQVLNNHQQQAIKLNGFTLPDTLERWSVLGHLKETPDSHGLFLKWLPPGTTRGSILARFEQYGQLHGVWMVRQRRQAKLCAYVDFEKERSAQRAWADLARSPLIIQGHPVHVLPKAAEHFDAACAALQKAAAAALLGAACTDSPRGHQESSSLVQPDSLSYQLPAVAGVIGNQGNGGEGEGEGCAALMQLP